jgi:(2Fe-2S) ferredoxin
MGQMPPESLEIPVVFRYHAFCCVQQRPPGHPRGSCAARGSSALWERLGARVQSGDLPGVAMVSTGCLGFCNAGPLMVVYPEGIWYRPTSVADVDEIVESHFVGGRPVERLIVVPQP